jgi:hypothetical protein
VAAGCRGEWAAVVGTDSDPDLDVGPLKARVTGHGSSNPNRRQPPSWVVQGSEVGHANRCRCLVRPTESRDVEGDNTPVVRKFHTAAPRCPSRFAIHGGRLCRADFSWSAYLWKRRDTVDVTPPVRDLTRPIGMMGLRSRTAYSDSSTSAARSNAGDATTATVPQHRRAVEDPPEPWRLAAGDRLCATHRGSASRPSKQDCMSGVELPARA